MGVVPGAHSFFVDHRSGFEASDQASADDARVRLRKRGIVSVEPDERIGVMLAPGERVVAVRRAIAIERLKDERHPERALRGDLYVTTNRLVCLGQVPVDVPLVEIKEAVVVAGVLRLVIGHGRGLGIRTRDPLLLRVELSAVREAARGAASSARPVDEGRHDTTPGTGES